ncbi:hypothetical protein XELAEV_18033561mg [Xenopus laevis]|uniref:Uncharacterized protein n=1 Tax=Xenopus laevis TaxID=8355 RepID=A0A974CLU5_XENLA|nr:hypothetical protein XELAEV_18033561mg [Xenopus laevis]
MKKCEITVCWQLFVIFSNAIQISKTNKLYRMITKPQQCICTLYTTIVLFMFALQTTCCSVLFMLLIYFSAVHY